jgi:hypothetical protein
MRLWKIASFKVMFAAEIEVEPQCREDANLATAEWREGVTLNVRVDDFVRVGHYLEAAARACY